MHTTDQAPHLILSFKTRRACDGQPRRTEVFYTFGYEGWDHPQSIDAAEPQSLGQYCRPEYARAFGWQRLLESLKSTGFDISRAHCAEIPPDNYGQLRPVDLQEIAACAEMAERTAARVAARSATRAQVAQQPAHA